MFESYIRGVFYYNYLSCHQLHTVALSFLPYAAGENEQVDFFALGIYNVYTKGGADYASSS